MAPWTSLVVLSVAVVSTLSFPRPDAEYKIPTVGLGARSQYYVLHSDGSYKYGYDSGDGIYEQAMAQTPGDVTGAFGYKDPSGADIKLEYTADNRGFLPRGSHLPVAPDVDFGERLPAAPVVLTKAAPVAYDADQASVAVSAPATPVEVADVRSFLSDDGSYSFYYDTSSSSRSESADAHNSVTGRYSFVADDGVNRRIDYVAGSETGYIAEGDSLPVGPSVPGAESGIPTGRILPVLSEEEANALAAATSDSDPVSYNAGVGDPRGDASYSFSYNAGDSSRSESADADLNVQGTYRFSPPGTSDFLTVNYGAGSDTGFVAEGAHLPVAPETDFDSSVSAALPVLPTSLTKAAPTVYDSSAPASVAAPVRPVEVADVRSSLADDGSYSFSYDASSSSRSESADAHNSVTGRYSFVADDGINRRIDYIAGSETGYIAEGDSLPVGPSVPGAESGIPTGRILPVLSEEEANALAAATSDSDPGSYNAGVGDPRGDASYSFSYDAGDSSRSESADADLNVQGTYRFSPPGTSHFLTVNYGAGANTGFVAEGDHLPVAPETDFDSSVSAALPVLPTSLTKAAPTVYDSSAPASVAVSAPATPVEVADVRSSHADDGSYSFSYDASSSSRSESADAHNSVTGRYSFVADDGVNRRIDYVAGSETGYIAEGDSLPVGPSVPGAESGIPTGRILPVLSEEEANALAAATSDSGPVSYTAGGAGGPRGDASYSFSYDAGDSSRSESADADLNVRGTYSFVPPETSHRLTINYRAGADTGFIAERDSLPIGPSVPGAESGIPTGGILPVLSEEDANALAAPVSAGVPDSSVVSYSAPPAADAVASHSAPDTGSSATLALTHSEGQTGQVVGNVLVHQYPALGGKKYGYSFTALRR